MSGIARRNSTRSGSLSGASGCVGTGRLESGSLTRLRAFDCSSRRRASSCSNVATFASGTLPNDETRRLNQSFLTIALRFLFAIDLWFSKRLGVCACEDSLFGTIRPLVKLVGFSGHGVPWLAYTFYLFITSGSASDQEVTINLFIALGRDLALVAIVRALTPSCLDTVFLLSVDCCSFPSSFATRAALCARFLLAHLVQTDPLRALVLAWAALVGLSLVLLGRHNVTSIVLSLAMGYYQYCLVERFWVSLDWLQGYLFALSLIGESQTRV